jgi:GRF zinc finger
MVYVQSEPQDTSNNSPTPSAVDISANKGATPLSPPAEASGQTRPSCDCGNPVAEKVCMGLGNPENKGRLMYVCARLGGERCAYFQWKDETSGRTKDRMKQQPESVPPADDNKTPEREAKPVSSNLMSPTSPQRPPPPQGTYTCNCGKPARQYFCRNGRPENVNKYYYKCAEEKCGYWEWIESDKDAQKRINTRKRKRDKEKWICSCGRPAIRLVSKHGMSHNIGRPFYKCATSKCEYWIWADGTLPFSDQAQARFNDWMDAQSEYWEDYW